MIFLKIQKMHEAYRKMLLISYMSFKALKNYIEIDNIFKT